ncbi:MAG: Receptor family ligand binding region [Firmicutes bacterium ADurb.Bin419]|nr:MAG: Receptor family ligand binding region [Firmicutes bacterium ADurb.Bin419]
MEENAVPWLFPMGPPKDMVFPPKQYLFNLFPTHYTQLRVITQWLKEQAKWQNVGIIYSDNEAGKAGLEDFKNMVKGSNMQVVVEQAIEEGAGSAAVQVAKIKEANPDLVFLVGMTHAPAALAIKEIRNIGWDVQIMIYMPITGDAILTLATPEDTEGLLGAFWGYQYDLHNPDANSPCLKDAYDTMVKYFPDSKDQGIDGIIEHYLSVEVFIEALRRAGENPTRESLISALESLDNYDMCKGFCTFSPNRREGVTGGVIKQVVDGQWKNISKFIDPGLGE